MRGTTWVAILILATLNFVELTKSAGTGGNVAEIEKQMKDVGKKFADLSSNSKKPNVVADAKKNIKVMISLLKKLGKAKKISVRDWVFEFQHMLQLVDISPKFFVKHASEIANFALSDIKSLAMSSKVRHHRHRGQINNIRSAIKNKKNILKNLKLNQKSGSSTAKSTIKEAVEQFRLLARVMHRDNIVTDPCFLQLKFRSKQSQLDMDSVNFDMDCLLKQTYRDPRIAGYQLIKKSLKADLGKLVSANGDVAKAKKILEPIVEERQFLVLFEVIFRKHPQKLEDDLAAVYKNLKSASDIKKSVKIIKKALSLAHRELNEIYYNH